MTGNEMEPILGLLASGDAFERLEGERALRAKTHRDFGYRWDAPAPDREEAILRVRTWGEEQRKRARKGRSRAAPGFAALDLAALKDLPPTEMEQKLRELLEHAKISGNVVFGRPRCEECGKRAATVQVTEPHPGGEATVRRLCDPCAARRGEIRG